MIQRITKNTQNTATGIRYTTVLADALQTRPMGAGVIPPPPCGHPPQRGIHKKKGCLVAALWYVLGW